MRLLSLPLLVVLVACKPPATPVPDEPVRLGIASVNDFHGALYASPIKGEEGRTRGGLPWLVGAVDTLRAEDPDLLLLDGGDMFQGSWPVNATRGRGSVQAMELMKLDASVIGNHEFDYGGTEEEGHAQRGAIEAALADAEFAWLSANITTADGSPWTPEGLARWTVLERRGLRIGLVGLSTVDTPQTTLLKNVSDLTFRDGVEVVTELLPELEAADLDVTILLGHLSGTCETPDFATPNPDCVPDDEIGRLLAELPPGTFDVMVLGHAHTLMSHRIGDTFVLESRSNGRLINHLELAVGPDGVDLDASILHQPWDLAHDAVDPGCEEGEFDLSPRDLGGRIVTPSTAALELITTLEAAAGSLCTELGCNEALLSRSRDEESPLGDFVADAMLTAFPEVDVAIQNSGGLRADLPAGKVRREQIQDLMPFDNRIVLVEMTGTQLELLFRIGSSGAHGIMQVAGATYAFDPARTEASDLDGNGTLDGFETDRLCGVTVGGEPLEPDTTYRVAVNDFMYAGGDHLGPVFSGTALLAEGPLLREHLFAFVEEMDTCIEKGASMLDPSAPRVVIGACAQE